jgi:hypothetical protein
MPADRTHRNSHTATTTRALGAVSNRAGHGNPRAGTGAVTTDQHAMAGISQDTNDSPRATLDDPVREAIANYELDGIEAAVLASWLHRPEPAGRYLLALTDAFNEAIVHAALGSALDRGRYSAAEIVRQLDDEHDASPDDDLEAWLAAHDSDPQRLESNFITTDHLYRYCTEFRFGDTIETWADAIDEDATSQPGEFARRLEMYRHLATGASSARHSGYAAIQTARDREAITNLDVNVRVRYRFECPNCRAELSPVKYIQRDKCPGCTEPF